MRASTKRTTAAAVIILLAAAAGVFAGGAPETGTAGAAKEISFGVAPGPYGDLISYAVKPGLEKRGYTVRLVQFQDYVQPNLALANGETTANLFQHQPYLAKFSQDRGLKLSPVIRVPTAGLGIYSRRIRSLADLKAGDEVTLAQDPTNLARALRFLQKEGLITLSAEIDASKASEKDVAGNPRGLRLTPMEAAQIPRSLDSVTIAVVNGNFAIAAGLKLSEALVLEQLDEDMKNLVAVRTEDLGEPFVKDIVEVIESEDFARVVEDPKHVFSGFQKPEWYARKWGSRVNP